MNKVVMAVILFLSGLAIGTVEAQTKPLKVFILGGQSNMQGPAHVRTLPHIGMDHATKPLLDRILDEKGERRLFDNIWISYLSSSGTKTGMLSTDFGAEKNKMGPELTFGIFMQQWLGEPILIIKTAWGGKSLHTDFRPPSTGAFQIDPIVLERLKQQGQDIEKIKSETTEAVGVYHRQTIGHVHRVLSDIRSVYPQYDSDQGFVLSGMIWVPARSWRGSERPSRKRPPILRIDRKWRKLILTVLNHSTSSEIS